MCEYTAVPEDWRTCYAHIPIGKVWMYLLLFVFLFLFVCAVTDFSGEDKASGIKFCTEVYWRPGQGISHFGGLCSPVARNWTNRRAANGRRIGMC